MPLAKFLYTLAGFSIELDWRRLRFLEPIPQLRVCGACGVVRKKAALLPCMHTLCESCYHQSEEEGVRGCPLDGHRFMERDVEIRDIDATDILSRKVKCWNEESGCMAELPASQIGQHYQNECQHHTVCCHKCSADVLCSEVHAHLRSEYCISARPSLSEFERASIQSGDMALLSAMKETSDAQRSEISAVADLTQVGAGRNTDRLLEVWALKCSDALAQELRKGVSSVKETMRREVARVLRGQVECQRKCLDEVTAFSNETKNGMSESRRKMEDLHHAVSTVQRYLEDSLSALLNELTKVSQIADDLRETRTAVSQRNEKIEKLYTMLRLTDAQVSVHGFVVKGVKSLRDQALKGEAAVYEGDKVYLRGYYMSPGVIMNHKDGVVTLHARFHIHMGDNDSDVHWPFRKTIKLCVIHPDRRADRELQEHVVGTDISCQRPLSTDHGLAFCTKASLNLDDLCSEGYVTQDQLRVEFQVMQ